MRLQRDVPVAGLDPEWARTLARQCTMWAEAEGIAYRLQRPERQIRSDLEALEAHAFLIGEPTHHDPSERMWRTTIAGSALTMASFLKPISRAKAQALLAGVLERAAAYDADPAKPYVITQIAVFGSYLDPNASDLGDLDLAVTMSERTDGSTSAEAVLAYARASGRSFSNFTQELFFAQNELLRTLKNRSGYINVHTEDVTRFTDNISVVYPTDGNTPRLD